MIIKNKKELDTLREGGRRLAAILEEIAEAAGPGVKAVDLDALAESLINKAGGIPSFKGYKVHGAPYPYPASLCISSNEEVVHGLPSGKILNKGDLIGLDIGMWFNGLCTDTAVTVLIGGGTHKLIDFTREALHIGISEVKNGARIGDIGHAIQEFLESRGLGVVRELVGHGVGRAVHEDPEIPNWGKPGTGKTLKEGMVVAMEPMATLGGYKVKAAPDGWAWVTKDGSLSAHFEHTLVVTKTGAEILTKAC